MKKILILAASPTDNVRLRLEQEVRDIDEGLRLAQHRDKFDIKVQLAARLKDLQQAMLDEKPNIVHFCGHSDQKTGIFLEDDDGKARTVPIGTCDKVQPVVLML